MRFHRILVLLLVPLLVAGCSRMSILYRTADFLIERYADDYLSVDSEQLAAWRPTLAAVLARHRREELPHLAAFFGDFHEAARAGFNDSNIGCLLEVFEDLYGRNFRLAAEAAAPLLVSLRPRQVRELERKFAKDAAKAARKNHAQPTHRLGKRAKRWSKSITWWTGPLSDEQRKIVREITAAMPDAGTDWAAYREARQSGLIRLLKDRAGESEVRRYLTDWLAYHRNLPPSLRTAKQGFRDRIVRLFVRLDASFSRSQRTHFEKRLATLRDDFMDVQKNPRMAPSRCAK